jgi:LuxR family maltose regulon positive regulatory protein
MIAREVALSERWDDAGSEVRQADLALSRDPERRLAFEGTRALGEALAGRPVDALRVAAGVRRAAAVSSMTILRAELATAEAVAHRELGDHPRALGQLAALADEPIEPVPYCRILSALELVEARLDEAHIEAARDAFGQAEALVEAELPGPGGRGWLARVGTRLALAAGEIDDARRWSKQVDDPFWAGISVARVRLADGDRSDALAALDSVVPRCVRHEVVLGLLRSRALVDHDESVKAVTAAVELAAANGVLQTVASEGADTIELVEQAAWRAPRAWMDRLRRAAVPGRGGSQLDQHDLRERLTERERDVLRFLPSRLTLREIAAELHVSVNTLKFHLKVIYRKLGVSSRAEAAEVARRRTVSGH